MKVIDLIIIIGTPCTDGTGSVYVYALSTNILSLKTKLEPINGKVDDEFGNSIAISSNTVIAGATQGNHRDINSGSAHLCN